MSSSKLGIARLFERDAKLRAWTSAQRGPAGAKSGVGLSAVVSLIRSRAARLTLSRSITYQTDNESVWLLHFGLRGGFTEVA